jgi:hypothetical protein
LKSIVLPIDQRTADHQKAKEQTVLFVPRRGRFKIEDSNTAKCLQSILGEVLHDELTVPARNSISEGPVQWCFAQILASFALEPSETF